MNIVFLQVGEDPRAAIFVRSIRQTVPSAYIVQCSDDATAEIDGVNKVLRREGSRSSLMTMRLESFAAVNLSGPGLYLDTDMLMLRPFDPKQLLGAADVVLCDRVFNRNSAIKTRPRGIDISEHDGKTLAQVYPFLACFVIAKTPAFWKACLDNLSSLPAKFQFWYGDQEAIRNVARSGPFKIARVKESDFACLPDFVDRKRLPFIVHFKGGDRKGDMAEYARAAGVV